MIHFGEETGEIHEEFNELRLIKTGILKGQKTDNTLAAY